MSGHRISIAAIATERFWQVAVLTAAGSIGFTSHADAAVYYWGDYPDFGDYRPGPPAQPRKQKTRRNSDPKKAVVEKETFAKPLGPLIIAISIEQQKVRVFDANGFFAESPVSTGTKTHPTPMGVFSIIQKHKLHHSNIYSGAPMPFMQRITWSGVAMHAGVLPGYPASHGCIRMPLTFAQKMWNWTRMGARVIVTPGEITPASFSHPLLVTQKTVPPQPTAFEEPKPDAPLAVKSDKGADARSVLPSPTNSEVSLELRSTLGHGPTPARDQTRTADASSSMPSTSRAPTMSDAAPSGSTATATNEAEPVKTSEASSPEANSADVRPEMTKSEAEPDSAERRDVAATDDKPVEAQPSEIVTGEIRASEPSEAAKPAEKAAAASTDVKNGAPKAATVDEPKTTEKPAAPKAVVDVPGAIEVKKDPARLPSVEKAAKAEPKREGQIAVFISRKDGKLYVRQNFKPVFDVPVSIAPSDRLLGTHVFTAEVDRNDPNLLRWSVVSLPVVARNPQKYDEDGRSMRRRKVAGAVPAEAKPLPVPNSPAEALDRITIPPEAMARITEALTTGGSIVVSDHGINNGGETGEGTDFIVALR